MQLYKTPFSRAYWRDALADSKKVRTLVFSALMVASCVALSYLQSVPIVNNIKITWGFLARGVFTNEAGLGMSAIAHACADVEEPAEQGMWGIFEVFFATLVICTVTALVILTSGLYSLPEAVNMINRGVIPESMLGAPLTAAGFGTVLGRAGEWIVSLSLVLFAFTSLLGAGYYGRRGVESLTGRRWAAALYQLAFPACVVFGSVGDLTSVWLLVDVFNGLLAVPNLLALMLLSPEVLRQLRGWLDWRRAPSGAETPG